MKKIIFLIALLSIIVLSGCNNEKDCNEKYACEYGCNLMYDELNFEGLLGTFENRTTTDKLLSQCIYDCGGKYK